MSLWDKVSRALEKAAEDATNKRLNAGQRASLHAIAERLPQNGVIIADEVGMGKTRIAVEVAKQVKNAKGRIAILVPPGLGYQWETELRDGGISDVRPLLRSLWSYFAAWQAEEQQPWFDEQLVMLSHAFANWRLGENSPPWRWALLPELYALWREERNGQLPRYYRGNCKLDDPWVKNAGRSIINNIQDNPSHPEECFLDKLLLKYRWSRSLEDDYKRGSEQREQLEKCIGLGLGVFDLLIVDEAHKSRGDDSGLSRLLNNLTWRSPDARVICMTATPVELDSSQWVHSLGRIGVDSKVLDSIKSSIDNYTNAASKLRKLWRNSEEVRKQYGEHAKQFQKDLSPYVLRRDKRDDDTVKKFQEKSGLSLNEYRCEREITVEPDKLSPEWQQAICSAEALSFATRMAQDSEAKRLRLTLGSGHGIASMLDQTKTDEKDDSKQREYDHQQEDDQKKETDVSSGVTQDKREERIRWWKAVMKQAFTDENALYDHPAILATVSVIEDITQSTQSKEKVLVFGRYTKPLRILTEILNARAMLMALEEGVPWPQSSIHNGESYNKLPMSVHTAFYQLRNEGKIKPVAKEPILGELNEKLKVQYKYFRNKQEQFQRSLIKNLEAGFKELGVSESDEDVNRAALRGFIGTPDENQIIVVARAVSEMFDTDKPSPCEIASGFLDLVKAARDRDDPDADEDGDENIDEEEARNYWKMLFERMAKEYDSPRGGFARLMYGGTAQSTRRMLQLAFNRIHSFPKVLVAQSMVGREGLNLHEACRTVVMLHPEWNPGVVEQQIGRVDRVGSYWSKVLDEAIQDGKSGDELPRIEVRPVVFKGTYDEHNWKVLRKRWDDLRSQLHGIVIPNSRIEKNDTEGQKILCKITKQTPDFSPARQVENFTCKKEKGHFDQN